MLTGTLSIGAVAERLGISADTLRYYERTGVVPPADRDARGRRRYAEGHLHLLEVLLHLRNTGMPLTRIAEFTRQVLRDPEGVPERLKLLRDHRAVLAAEIGRLNASLAVVDGKIADYRARSGA